MSKNLGPWERQENEPESQYDLFVAFLEMGTVRNLIILSKMYMKPISTIRKYSSRWKWYERANQYDTYINYSPAFPFMDNLCDLEDKKIQSKVSFSEVCLNLIEKYIPYLFKSDNFTENRYAKEHIKYLRDTLKALKQLFDMADFSLHPALQRAAVNRALNFEKIINPDKPEKDNFFLNDIKNINLNINAPESNINAEWEIPEKQQPALQEISFDSIRKLDDDLAKKNVKRENKKNQCVPIPNSDK